MAIYHKVEDPVMVNYHKEIEEIQGRWDHIMSLLNDDQVAIFTYALESFEPESIEWHRETVLIWQGLMSRFLAEYKKRSLHYSSYQRDWNTPS